MDFSISYQIDEIAENQPKYTTIIYDCYHSRPKNIEFKLNDKIIFEGIEMYIKDIKIHNNANGKAQHFEMRCE